jgi:hypothetical protein
MNANANYDRIIIEFQKDGKSVVSTAINNIDLETMVNLHGQKKSEVIAMIVEEMHSELQKKDGVSARSDES